MDTSTSWPEVIARLRAAIGSLEGYPDDASWLQARESVFAAIVAGDQGALDAAGISDINGTWYVPKKSS